MNHEAEFNKVQILNEPDTNSATAVKKPYSTPALTEFGQMNELTREGGGPGPNDGDYQVGTPLTS